MSGSSLTPVRELLPQIRERAAEIEAARRVPEDLVAALKSAGIFRILLPESYGGIESDYPSSVQLLSELAKADGSVGWSMMIGCETPQLMSLLPRTTFDGMYADGPDVVIGGAFAPKGSASIVDGGYRASGQWGFASGCEHADWLFGNCVLPSEEGPPALRCVVLPREEWEIVDTWHTAGLRGTGSHDIRINDVFVPEERTFDLFGGTPNLQGPLFAAPLMQFNLHIGAVALGISQGALDELTEFARAGKTRLYGRSSMADGELFQYRLGHAEADVLAAGAFLEARANEYWEQARAGTLRPDMRERILLTVAWVVETSVKAVDACYTAGGGSSIYEGSPLQRRLRDIHTLSQHAATQEGVFANAGAARLGEEVSFGL